MRRATALHRIGAAARLVAAALLLAPGVGAQEVVWVDPKPGAGAPYARAATGERLTTREALRAAPADAGAAAVSSGPWVVLLCKYPDAPGGGEVAPPAHYERYVASPDYPSVRHYWHEVSGGRVDMAGTVVKGWYTLPQPHAAYVGGAGGSVLQKLRQDCMAAADADVFFPDFDGVIMQFSALDGASYGSTSSASLDGVSRGYRTVWLDSFSAYSIGSIAHEVGHTLGLPHSSGMYGATYDSRWDVMSVSSWVPVPGTDVRVGAHTIAPYKDRLGLVPAARKVAATAESTTVRLERSALPPANDDALLVTIPIPGPGVSGYGGEYFTLEARRRVGYDAPLAGEGVVIHRVVAGAAFVVDPDGNAEPSDEGALWTVGETWRDRETGVRVRVDGEEGSAFRVTVLRAAHPTLAAAPAQRARTVAFGAGVARADSAVLAFGGAGAATRAWRASVHGRRLALANPTGLGSGTLRWTEAQAGIAAGTWIDTVFVVADGLAAPLLVIDTLVVTAPATLALGVDAPPRADSVMPGRASQVAIVVRPSGPGASSAAWRAAKRAAWLTFLDEESGAGGGAGVGQGMLWLRHDAAGLAPGIYVDTVTLTAEGAPPARLVDTLRVLAPPAIALARRSGSRRMAQSGVPVIDSIAVAFSGPDAAGLAWVHTVSADGGRYLEPVYTGVPNVGAGWLRLRWNPGALAPGTYVNRATVAAYLGGPVVAYVDTLVVEPTPRAIVLSAASRADTVAGTSSLSRDSVWVQPQGSDAAGASWWALRRDDAHVVFQRSSGSNEIPGNAYGPGWLKWVRNTAGRASGVYVDTVWVRFAQTAGADSARLLDSLVVVGGAATLALSPGSRRAERIAGDARPAPDSAVVTLAGAPVGGDAWSAASRAPWLTLLTPAGRGSGVLRWTRSAAALAPGVYIDTIVLTAAALPGAARRLVDTLRVLPALVIASEPARRAGVVGASYADTLRATGALRPVWGVDGGALPPGLALDSLTGVLSGRPESAGTFRFVARARADSAAATREMTLAVAAPVLDAGAVLDALLGGAPLDEDRARYLDLQGNRNGRVDVGDVRRWLRTPAGGAAAATAAGSRLRALAAP